MKNEPYFSQPSATKLLAVTTTSPKLLSSFFNGQKPLLTSETARVAHSRTYFNNAALLQTLPGFSYTPLEVVIKNACKKYIAALQSGQLSL